MHPVIRRIEIQDQLLRRCAERLHQYPVYRNHPGTVRLRLEPAQRRRAHQHRVAVNRRLQRRIVAQLVVIVRILMTRAQGMQPLTKQIQPAVPATRLTAGTDDQPGARTEPDGPARSPASLHHCRCNRPRPCGLCALKTGSGGGYNVSCVESPAILFQLIESCHVAEVPPCSFMHFSGQSASWSNQSSSIRLIS